MALAQEVNSSRRKPRRGLASLPAVRLDTLVAYLVFIVSVGFTAACVFRLVP